MSKKSLLSKENVTMKVEEASNDQNELDWIEAGNKLKSVVTNIKSIDNYFRQDIINAIRERFNNRERTEELYNEIMNL